MDSRLWQLLVCPKCGSTLIRSGTLLSCESPACAAEFPVVNGIPVLINDDLGTFRKADYSNAKPPAPYSRFRDAVKRYAPRITANLSAKRNFLRLRQLLTAAASRPVVLVIGGAEAGAGADALLSDRGIDFVESDVIIGSRTNVVCDGACLPLASESVDGVVIQAVLEYMVDPQRCIDEIHRVLRPQGLVYSEAPFLQGVHGGTFDFSRFTLQGHRRLYRRFREIASGACAGPATTLALSLRQLLLSCFNSVLLRDITSLAVSLTFFWVKYFDYLLIRLPGALDAAPGTFLMAEKANRVLLDRELLLQYRGAASGGSMPATLCKLAH